MGAVLLGLVFAGCKSLESASLIVGSTYACLFDTTLDCQLVDSHEEESQWGEDQPPVERFESVVGSYYHLCGISIDGEVLCWGWDGMGGQVEVPTELEVSEFVLGYSNSCALDSEGYLTCWGNEWTGINDAPEGPFDMVAVSGNFGCGWSKISGWSCWGGVWGLEEAGGDRYDWSLPDRDPASLIASGLNICMLDSKGRIDCWGNESYAGVTSPPSGDGWRDLSVGTAHACAIDVNDQVVCWGRDVEEYPWRSAPDGRWLTFTAGPRADCGIREDGEIDCWGCIRVDPITCDWDD